MVTPEPSTLDDFEPWLRLAGEVEPLFGPMVAEPAFHEGLRQAIRAGHAFRVKVKDPACGDAPGFQGGVVVSPEANEIVWLAVSGKSRGQGIGKALLEEAIRHMDPGRPMTVTTFAESVAAGLPARALYLAYGFRECRDGGPNPAGIPTVVMVRATPAAGHGG